MISNNRTKYITEMYKNDSPRPAGCTTDRIGRESQVTETKGWQASLTTAWFVKEIICHVYQM